MTGIIVGRDQVCHGRELQATAEKRMIDILPKTPNHAQGWPWNPKISQGAGADRDGLPTITVVTPSYNQGDYLEATLRSVLLQDYPKLEYIVVDGGSTDRSNEILDRYASHITHLIREPDDGQSDAICKGIKLASGQFFNWMNSDDCLRPGTLWELAKRFTDDTNLYAFSVLVEGEGIDPYLMHNQNLSARGILRADRYSFSQPGLWYRLDRLRACGGIDSTLNYGFDWDLLIRYLSQNPSVKYSSNVGAMFRLHDQSKTIIESSKMDAVENRFHRESELIRNKLEQTLSKDLVDASRLGRRREPWNQYLVDLLDDVDRSPLATSIEILKNAAKEPPARFSGRMVGAVARLLSRYVRRRP